MLSGSSIEVDKFLWDINGDPNLHSDIRAGDELIYSFNVTNTGASKLSNVQLSDTLPGVVLQDDVVTNFVAYEQPIKVVNNTALGPFSSVDRTLASDPFEAKAWDNFSLSEQTVIDGFSWDGGYIEPFATGPNAQVPETDFVIEISADNAGMPGNILHTFSLDGGKAGISDGSVKSTLLGHTAQLGGPVYHYSASISFTSLAAGDYWISISAAQTFPSPSPLIDPTWLWHNGAKASGADGFFTYDDTFDDPGDNDNGLVDSIARPVAKETKELAFALQGARVVDFSGMLDPGESVMFMGTYIVTQDDVQAGRIVNQATVTADPPTGAKVTDSDTETVIINRPETGIEVDKFLWDINGSPNLHSNLKAGDELIYSFNVTNTGATTLTNVQITDPLPGMVIDGDVLRPYVAYEQPIVIPGDLNLGPFASVDRTLASDPFEAKAWDNFSLSGRTVIDGISWDGAYIEPFAAGLVPETDFLVEIFTDHSGLPGSVLHSFSLVGGDAGVDDGNVRSTLLGHTAQNGGPVYSYEAMLPFTVLNAGDYWVSITALQTFPNPAPIVDPTWQWHLGTNLSGADGSYFYDDTFDDAGDNGVGAVDGTPHPANFDGKDLAFQLTASELLNFDGTLLPGQSVMFMGTYIVTKADVAAGQIVNTATASGDTTLGFAVSDVDTEIVRIDRPESGLELDKFLWDINGNPNIHADIKAGDQLIYAFEITNTGSTGLSNVTLADPLPGLFIDGDVIREFTAYEQPLRIPGDLNLGPFASVDRTLASDPFEAKAWENFSLGSETVVDGISWAGAYIEPFATGAGIVTPQTDFLVEIFSNNGGLPGSVLHSFPIAGGLAGINDAQVTTTLLGHTAANGGPVYHYDAVLPFTTLPSGDYWISITAQQTFPNADPVIDPTWQWHVGTNLSGADGFYTYDDTFDDVGDNDVGANDGTPHPADFVALKDLTFRLQGAALQAWDGVVAPGETVKFMGFYDVTQADVNAGMILNEATVTGKLPDGTTLSDSDQHKVQINPSNQRPAIHVSKLINGEDADEPKGPIIAVGETATWIYEVTNIGNVTLSHVQLTDDQGVIPVFDASSDRGGDGLLSPGEVWMYEASELVVEGQYSNLATVTGKSPAGVTVSDTDPAFHFGCKINPGDINGDGVVTFADFLILSVNFDKTNATPAMGDLNCDGVVNFADFLILSANFGASVPASTGAAAASTDVVFANGGAVEDWLI